MVELLEPQICVASMQNSAGASKIWAPDLENPQSFHQFDKFPSLQLPLVAHFSYLPMENPQNLSFPPFFGSMSGCIAYHFAKNSSTCDRRLRLAPLSLPEFGGFKAAAQRQDLGAG